MGLPAAQGEDMMRLRLVSGVAALALGAASCGEAAEQPVEDAEPVAAVTPAAAQLEPEPEASEPESTDTSAGIEASVLLVPGGLQIASPVEGRGTATTLTFGQSQSRAQAAMTEVLGKPRIDTNDECGAGPMEFANYGDILLHFQGGKFVGWWANGSGGMVADIGADNGLAIGARKAAVSKLEGFSAFEESTLGDEFMIGTGDGIDSWGISGMFDDQGRVTDLWSGVSCTFR